jgi:hypothetical protein
MLTEAMLNSQVDPSQSIDNFIIIIVLKPDLGVNPRQGSGHGSGRSTQLIQNFYFFLKKVNKFLTYVLSQVDMGFLLS